MKKDTLLALRLPISRHSCGFARKTAAIGRRNVNFPMVNTNTTRRFIAKQFADSRVYILTKEVTSVLGARKVLNRLIIVYSAARARARFVPIVLVLSLFGCGGSSSHNIIPTTPVTPSLSANLFGFQCAVNPNGCPYNGTDYTWPTTQAQPGVLRLWDASVQWNVLNTASGTYNWSDMDHWLDAIAANTPRAVIYTFGWVPFWDAPSTGTCQTASTRGSACPPLDLTTSGSATFNTFVTALVGHCSPAGNCVATYIKYFEMWNEADTSVAWTGTVAQLYQMESPAVTIIKDAISGVEILTPPLSANPGTSVRWMCSWLAQEISTGSISDIYAFHIYLQNATPESTLAGIETQISPNLNPAASCALSGWTTHPFWLTETNYANSTTPDPYTCDLSLYTADDCTGQIVRWQLLFNSNGGAALVWYSWLPTIGSVAQNETAYYYMMQYLEGGTLTAPCSSSGSPAVYTCPFTEANSTVALWVWTPSEAGTSYTVPSGYTDYRDLGGGTTSISGGQTITIGTEPFMLEM